VVSSPWRRVFEGPPPENKKDRQIETDRKEGENHDTENKRNKQMGKMEDYR